MAMSPAHVLEPTYQAIKRRLMRGEWAGGTRLESARIAEELGVSLTPVRDSLSRLAGEKMVDFAPGEGFHVHRLTATELRDMLELNLILLLAAIATGRSRQGDALPAPDEGTHRIAALFHDVGRRSGNAELAAAVAALNDRLHVARRFDVVVLGETGPEIKDIEAALDSASGPGAARNLILRYHERRAQEADSFARLLAGSAP
jgi:DNA-binding GntR family transcriptional regulator